MDWYFEKYQLGRLSATISCMTIKKAENKYYYHITSFQGWAVVHSEGLNASEDGYIYLLDTEDNRVCTALIRKLTSIKVFSSKGYGVFRIDPAGITAPVETDEDGLKYDTEFTLPHQFRVKQAKIESKYLKSLGMRHIIDPALGIDSRDEFKFAEKLKEK